VWKHHAGSDSDKFLASGTLFLPRIFDNIDLRLHPALTDTLKISHRADFCVGYFNLRGWKLVDQFVEAWPGGDGDCCRLIVGMSTLPQEELREAFSLVSAPDGLDTHAHAGRPRYKVSLHCGTAASIFRINNVPNQPLACLGLLRFESIYFRIGHTSRQDCSSR
jgi:hypothetical protein